ncbi:preprotein translocase subunit YajC [bacterium]|nr:preprotein translocase subunit YajC [bacterium]
MNTGTLLYVAVLVGAFYFLIIRPQQQRQREMRKLMSALSQGDRVITIGGMHGTVVRVLDSTVVLRVLDNTEIEFEKASIGRIVVDVPPVGDDEIPAEEPTAGDAE